MNGGVDPVPRRAGEFFGSEEIPGYLKKAAVLVILLAGFLIRLQVAPSYGHNGVEGDLLEYKMAIHRALTVGMHDIYTPSLENDPASSGKEWEGGYFITNPPARVYSYFIPVMVYRHFDPQGFDTWRSDLNFYEMYRGDFSDRMEKTRGFTVAMKIPAILADLIMALGIFWYLSARLGSFQGLLGSAVYALNPGVILDTAHLGSHDAVWIALLIASLYLVHIRKLELSWVLYALAALSKPQAMAFAPLIVFLGLIRFPVRRIVTAAVAAAGTCVLVFLPFILGGTLRTSISALVNATFGGEPLVSLNAMNIWWLATWGRGLDVPDTVRLIGPLTLRSLGLAAFTTANALVLWRLFRIRVLKSRTVFLAAATIGMAFFTLNTELHENHMMSVVPLVIISLSIDRRLWGMVAVLSTTFMVNLLLFDTAGLALLKRLGMNPVPVHAMSLTGAFVNTVAFAILFLLFWRFTSVEERSA